MIKWKIMIGVSVLRWKCKWGFNTPILFDYFQLINSKTQNMLSISFKKNYLFYNKSFVCYFY